MFPSLNLNIIVLFTLNLSPLYTTIINLYSNPHGSFTYPVRFTLVRDKVGAVSARLSLRVFASAGGRCHVENGGRWWGRGLRGVVRGQRLLKPLAQDGLRVIIYEQHNRTIEDCKGCHLDRFRLYQLTPREALIFTP